MGEPKIIWIALVVCCNDVVVIDKRAHRGTPDCNASGFGNFAWRTQWLSSAVDARVYRWYPRAIFWRQITERCRIFSMHVPFGIHGAGVEVNHNRRWWYFNFDSSPHHHFFSASTKLSKRSTDREDDQHCAQSISLYRQTLNRYVNKKNVIVPGSSTLTPTYQGLSPAFRQRHRLLFVCSPRGTWVCLFVFSHGQLRILSVNRRPRQKPRDPWV